MSTVLEVKDLHVSFKREKQNIFEKTTYKEVLRGIDLTVEDGEIVAIVGESGCGKSTLAKAILGLVQPSSGSVVHHSDRPQMIFQDPKASLNPYKTVGFILEEPLRNCTGLSEDERLKKAAKMLMEVGLPEEYLTRFPDELSGGQRQRVCIAESLMLEPKLLIADEPVSALDVTVQAQVLELLKRVHEIYGLSMLFISHDLRVVYQLCDRICVMRDGIIVEQGSRDEIYHAPRHEYTRSLLKSAGIID